jgi:XRE family transcriptional regulator, fatty acid utilization regulator
MPITEKPHINDANVRLIFGIKLKQLRLDKRMLLSELAEKSGISVSYLNEIEKGKKFPKPEKIAALAEALGVSYDWLISLQLKKSFAPVAKLLQSKILNEFPLEVFGINKSQLFELLSGAPAKLNAFLSTIIEISRNYGMRVEHFYFSALRSYQEMQENYFDDIEIAVEKFVTLHAVDPSKPADIHFLTDILQHQYHYEVYEDGLSAQPELEELKSVLLKGKNPRLMLNRNLTATQKAFILGREIGFNYLGIQERSDTTPWVEYNSFEQVLNNFKGSYFSCALLLNKAVTIERMQQFFANKRFEPSMLLQLISEFNISPEILCHRLTNLLPRFFGIQELFLLRFNHQKGIDRFELTKEIHLSGLHNPHTSMQHEHYCRRWISLNVLYELEQQLERGTYAEPLVRIQRSKYFGTDKEYLLLSFAKPSMKNASVNNSVSIGMLMTEQLKRKVRFWNDPGIPIRMVGETCERCPATDCAERKAPPVEIISTQKITNLRTALRALSAE